MRFLFYRIYFYLALTFCLFFISTGVFAAEDNLNRNIPNIKEFAHTKEWTSALFYRKGWLSKQSLVKDPSFFLSPTGQTDAVTEADTLYKKLITEDINLSEAESIQCKFPLRTLLLKRFLQKSNIIFPQRKCIEVENFLSLTNPQNVSLVFSSYYPNNPSSLFGHTFLKFSRKPSQQVNSPLLDLAVGYTAHPTTNNPFLFPFLGMAGGFPGQFDLLPYYVNVQEYSNSESRDLWEYVLNFSDADTNLILLALWEIKDKHIFYYYLDDNCAYMLLLLLEIGNSQLDLVNNFPTFVIPSDTLYYVARVPNLVKDIKFRPSVYRRFKYSFSLLTTENQNLLREIIQKQKDFNETNKLSPLDAAQLIDSLLEYIDYDERLAGSKESTVWAEIRNKALVARAKLGNKLTNSETEKLILTIPPPQEEAPHTGHPSSRIVAALGLMNQQTIADITWRPALHDLNSQRNGYSRQLEITFFEPTLRLHLNKPSPFAPQLEKFTLLHILGANPISRLIAKPAWQFDMEFNHDNKKQLGQNIVRFGLGLGFENSIINSFALGTSSLAYDSYNSLRLGIGSITGLILHLHKDLRISLNAQNMYFLGKHMDFEWKSTGIISYNFTQNLESRLEGSILSKRWEIKLSNAIYF